MDKDYFLSPIQVSKPPCHTQIKPYCATCKKFPVCSIREDYLKTAYLIQQILGDPQDDRELRCCDESFSGYNFDSPEKLFPTELDAVPAFDKTETLTGKLLAAKFRSKDFIQLLYDFDKYLVIFKVTWSEEFSRYELRDGKEVYYGIKYELKSSEFDDAALQEWRVEKIKEEEENKNKDIINTTYFSAILKCDFYEQDKHLTEKEGLDRMFMKWKKCGCDKPPYYHFATYHIENKEVPCLDHNFAPTPVLYPIFIPKCPPTCYPKRPAARRDDLNNE